MTRSLLVLAIAFSSLAAVPTRGASIRDFLDQAATDAETFWDNLSSISCTETVSQSKWGPDHKVLLSRVAVFDYVILLSLTGNELTVEESRIDVRAKGAKVAGTPKQPLLLTGGFSTLMLIFHPFFQASFEFEELPEEPLATGGKPFRKVGFRHIKGTPSPAALQLRGRDYPLSWQGVAWVGPDSGLIHRIQVEVGSSMEDVGLRQLRADASFSPVSFAGQSAGCWLPHRIVVDVRTVKQAWTNVHSYTDYKRFGVETKVNVGEVK